MRWLGRASLETGSPHGRMILPGAFSDGAKIRRPVLANKLVGFIRNCLTQFNACIEAVDYSRVHAEEPRLTRRQAGTPS